MKTMNENSEDFERELRDLFNKLPEHYTHIAQDIDGAWAAFTGEPKCGEFGWRFRDNKYLRDVLGIYRLRHYQGCWRKSLISRSSITSKYN